ncbi:MAG TPA: thiamine phosphate synthase [Amaricoccus sp.]|uniref:thiamine phosphate synthase n=1 Tax=Amaricoccus sp. TaxID=1872485 RepID=UPI002B7A0969|nr:thiamine phosphate synthase [Amaricoccus sp.]HMQ93167.1 thiamine phosphate synthase [Amaricoccus sp.]HMR53943.1 thiamine phosphate synthase [Amaricoccus sp.]HMR60193.1 thiamine phosphate synthase [Amaricoccus sp.]HMU00939.1 thiamine phosphate synthase [Amaricoccus sp.]
MRGPDLSLYLVLDPDLCRLHSMVETARAAVAGGATIVQLRDKAAGTEGLVEVGRALKAALAGTGVPLIVNDDLEAALAVGAEGLHLGQDDMPAGAARQRIGRGRILGLSVESEAAARAVDPAVVDYVGIGPVFATPTKPDHKPPIGFDGLARLAAISTVPSVAIGGLKAAHVSPVLDAGAAGMAVVSAICGQPDPEAAARGLSAAILNWRRRGPVSGRAR